MWAGRTAAAAASTMPSAAPLLSADAMADATLLQHDEPSSSEVGDVGAPSVVVPAWVQCFVPQSERGLRRQRCMVLAMFLFGCGVGVGAALAVQRGRTAPLAIAPVRFGCDRKSGQCVEGGGGEPSSQSMADCRASCVASGCVPRSGRHVNFPGNDDYRVLDLLDALHAANTSYAKQPHTLLVCSFADMLGSAGNLTVQAGRTLSITGHLAAGQYGPRLWGRFVINGTLFLTALKIRDQYAMPMGGYSTLSGAAAHVRPKGRLVARSVSFLRGTGTAGGAVSVGDGGMGPYRNGGGAVAEFYGCFFRGNQVTGVGANGGALLFLEGSVGIVAGCVMSNNHAATGGGAVAVTCSNDLQQPYRVNVTIIGTDFVGNSAGNDTGGDLYIERHHVGHDHSDVPCPAPGHGCDSSAVGAKCCCINGNYHGLDYAMPNT
jgi:hypothetical protein